MIGSKIKRLRQRKGFSISELAKKADVSKSYLSQLERDLQSNPSLQFLIKVSKTLECSMEYLLGEEGRFLQRSLPLDKEWTDLVSRAINEGMSKEDFDEYRRYNNFINWQKEQNKQNPQLKK